MYICNFFPHAAIDDSNKEDEAKPDQLKSASASDLSVDTDVASIESVAAPNIEVTVSESCGKTAINSAPSSTADTETNTYSKAELPPVLDDASPSVKDEISLPRSRTPSPKASPKRSPSRRVSELKEGN